jgi:hypothetical protein
MNHASETHDDHEYRLPLAACTTNSEGHYFYMHRPILVEALPQYRLHLVYPDGIEGIIDLSGEVGRGVFTPLSDEAFFRTVHIGCFGQIAWSEDLEICPDAAWFEITQATATEPSHA